MNIPLQHPQGSLQCPISPRSAPLSAPPRDSSNAPGEWGTPGTTTTWPHTTTLVPMVVAAVLL